MSRKFLIGFLLLSLQSPLVLSGKEKTKLTTEAEKISYTLGVGIGSKLKDIEKEIDYDAFILGVQHQFQSKKLLLTGQEQTEAQTKFAQKMSEQNEGQMSAESTANHKAAVEFLEKNKKEKNVKSTSSGLQYLVLTEGTGASPTVHDKIKIHYRGTLINGVEFDSSYQRGQPIVFPLSNLIKGWQEGIPLMKIGGKNRLFIPPELGYGNRSVGAIPANSLLIFEIELLGIEQ